MNSAPRHSNHLEVMRYRTFSENVIILLVAGRDMRQYEARLTGVASLARWYEIALHHRSAQPVLGSSPQLYPSHHGVLCI